MDNNGFDRPPDPSSLLSSDGQLRMTDRLLNFWQDKRQVLCITGAGISTESGIPDYRGSNGSYHRGHKPMVHDQFMSSEYQRKRYWGRAMVGWRSFDETSPSAGHIALARLERMQKVGVTDLEDRPEFYSRNNQADFCSEAGQRRQLAIVTQNVDSLHSRAGSKNVMELHGRANVLKCMQCGNVRDRQSFHIELDDMNHEWLQKQRLPTELRPDGDAFVEDSDFQNVQVPVCHKCGGFFKPDVVFFGDSVPAHRVALADAAVNEGVCDGILVVGSSLAVHSAFRHVRAASQRGIPIAILNVGPTRAEVEGLPGIVKIAAPVGTSLEAVASHFAKMEEGSSKPQ